MADSVSATLDATEMQSLADRLLSCGVSKLFDDSPSLQADLRAASRVIRSLLSEIDRVARITGDIERTLRDFKVTVQD